MDKASNTRLELLKARTLLAQARRDRETAERLLREERQANRKLRLAVIRLHNDNKQASP
jgi:hypothetical protein